MPRPRSAVLRVSCTALSISIQVSCGGDTSPPQEGPDGGPPCAPWERPLDDGRCQPPGLPLDMPCAPGERLLDDGRCQPAGLPLDMPCAPGERHLDDGRCQPAGVPPDACAPGKFMPDGRGGCEAILPPQPCSTGMMAVPGETACRDVAPCGGAPWGDIPIDATTQHVDQAYPGGDSDGSAERPWTTVQAGIRAARPGAIVAVAAGRYAGDVSISGKPVRLWGRCPAQTEIVGLGIEEGAITVGGPSASGSEVRGLAAAGPETGIVVRGTRAVTLEGVWVHDAGNSGVRVLDRAEVTLRGALIERNIDVGVSIEGSEAALEALVVRATQSNVLGYGGRGVNITSNTTSGVRGELAIRGSLLDQNHELGVGIFGSDATLDATVVRATEPDAQGGAGWGVAVQIRQNTSERGALTLTRSLIDENHVNGVGVSGADAIIDATVVRGTRASAAADRGMGVRVEDSRAGQRGALTLSASLIEDNVHTGVFVRGATATIDATIVRATSPNGSGESGQGIGVRTRDETGERGALSLSSSRIERNRDVGVFIGASDAAIEGTVVRATRPAASQLYGWGIGVQDNQETGDRGALSLTASLIEENSDTGVIIVGSDAEIDSTVVRATGPDGEGQFGIGIAVQHDGFSDASAVGRLSGVLVEQNRWAGIAVQGAEATIEASAVRATQSDVAGKFGVGIKVIDDPIVGKPATLALSTSLLEQNHLDGVLIGGSDATIVATVVRGTEPDGRGMGGRGISLQPDLMTRKIGRLWLFDSVLEHNHDLGIFVWNSEATIEGTAVRNVKRAPMGLELGDGILVMEGGGQSRVSIARTTALDNERAGLYYAGSAGELSGVRSSNNRFGLVLDPGQSGLLPMLGEGVVLEGNTEQDQAPGGDLPVPTAAPEIP